MKKKLYLKIFISFILFLFLIILLLNPKKYIAVTLDGLKLWVAVILPSVFPYAVITTLITSLNSLSLAFNKFTPLSKRLFNTNGVGLYAFTLSVISGYPIGSKTVADLKENGLLSNSEAIRCSCFCSSSSPMFIIGSVGTLMLNDIKAGVIIFISHFIATVLNGLIFRFYKGENDIKNKLTDKPVDNIIYQSVYSGVISILVVGGIVTLCFLICHILTDFKVLSPLTSLFSLIFKDSWLGEGFIKSLIEVSCGAKIMANSNSNLLLPLLSFSISFGGLSVFAQSIALLKTAKIKIAPFVLSKLTQAIFSFIITILILFALKPY